MNRSLWQKISILALVLLLGWWIFAQFTSTTKESTYQFVKVEKGDITQLVSETGDVATTSTVSVSSSITGIVTEVYVENGSSVTKGQKLFAVDSTATKEEQVSARATYLQAKSALETAQTGKYALQASMLQAWDEYKNLAESDSYSDENTINRTLPEFMIAQDTWLSAEAKYKAQEQEIAQAQVSLQKAALAYQAVTSGTVTATAPGLVENLAIASGQTVDSESAALLIAGQADQWVSVQITESEITKLVVGQKAVITVDALESSTVTAVVERIDSVGTESSGVVVYTVYLKLDATELPIKPGMTVQVDITTGHKADVLLVPTSAIKQYQGEPAVQILDSETSTVLYKPLTTGARDDVNTEVVSGLSEGEEVILSGASSTSTAGSNQQQGPGLFMGR